MYRAKTEDAVCESSIVMTDDERRQRVPLCAYRQTRYRHAYTTRSDAVTLYATRRDRAAHGAAHFDPLFDIRKYTHVVHIAGKLTLMLRRRLHDHDSTAVRLPFDCSSIARRLFDDVRYRSRPV